MKLVQVPLFETPVSTCPFADLIDHDDTHCNHHLLDSEGYEVVAENSPDIDDWLAEVRWVDIDDVVALDGPEIGLIPYIPTIPKGSNQLFINDSQPIVAVSLGNVVSSEKLSVIKSLEKTFGIKPGTKVILLCYGKDRLIERIWPDRHRIFREIAKLGFYAITSINYSIWDNQPHAERLINIKRGLLTFEDLQELELPAIPHVYWSGHKSLHSWSQWLNNNKNVGTVAVNLQTIRKDNEWKKAVADLKILVSALDHPVHFLVTGPQAPHRIADLMAIIPNLTLNNGFSAYTAMASHELSIDENNKMYRDYSPDDKATIFQRNTRIFESILAEGQANASRTPVLAKAPSALSTS